MAFDQHLAFFKSLADENRLKMAILLSQRKYSVGELAEVLGLTAPTVSHHLANLREIGLVNLGVVGNIHYYKLNKARLDDVRARLLDDKMLRDMSEHLLSSDPAGMVRQKAERARAQAEAWRRPGRRRL
jgi:DNA-binding transcriptional ArsR family regulator